MNAAKSIVGTIKGVAVAVLILGMLAAWVAAEDIPSMEMEPAPSVQPADWTPGLAKAYPTCTDADYDVPWIAKDLVTVERLGSMPQRVRWNDRTQARIDATWDDELALNDVFVVGKCP